MGRLLAFVIFLCGAALLGVAAYTYGYEDPDPLPGAAAIVVLSGPGGAEPGTGGETLARVERGVALYEAGLAPVLVMTGNGVAEGEATHAARMQARAVALGVPAEAVRVEPEARSTLQNAWLTREIEGIEPESPVILVTHRYHLPRAWASFRWAGFTDIALVAADAGGVEITPPLLMEGLKWPFNAIRAAAASAALAAGAEEAQVLPWLR